MAKINAQQVYALCREIPHGRVTTYRELASALGTKGYQAIGQILRNNPFAPDVPCHRVVRSDGSLGGFKGRQDTTQKQVLLEAEGIIIHNGIIDLRRYSFSFSFGLC